MTDVTEITVVSQNILLDKTREENGETLPQNERIASIARAILSLPYRPDIIGIQEAHITGEIDNGADLAALCGYDPGVWENHNLKANPPKGKEGRKHEYIGLFGPAIGETTAIDLGDNRKALMTEIGGIAFATLHFRAGMKGSLVDRLKHSRNPPETLINSFEDRLENANNLIDALSGYDDAVVFGDFNEPHTPRMRRLALGRDALAAVGYRSAFHLLDQQSPHTFPTPSYRKLYQRRTRWAIDDILIRGERARPLEAGTIEYPRQHARFGELSLPLDATDHEGVWAHLAISP